ncbi:TlyA family RNA methyltransferase [uncultured Ornithinimicrobium sp.]|uniref:TlyA family RNA methyltransferase n=1 Tax=uncultured Ornithinimicrobium sp. TaxID=259307 RepID=UPI002591A711|nr:TlyA family RNA methyltransferase [uncultured Ornithinimicrobium sp.]
MSTRLDAALVRRGLAPSRTQAQLLVRDGRVRVDGTQVRRPATPVADDQEVVLDDADEGAASAWVSEGWVGRGALKLRHALQEWGPQGLTVAGGRCLDVGASTGGFTQVLLAAGAACVLALDVGHEQLHQHLRDDPRVTDLSGTSIRDTRPETLGGPVDVVVADLSFISLRTVLPVVATLTAPDAQVVPLVKPQFEVGRAALPRDGVVRSAEQRHQVLRAVLATADQAGLCPHGILRSPLTGSHGNVEYLLWLRPRRTDMIGWALTPEAVHDRLASLREEEE